MQQAAQWEPRSADSTQISTTEALDNSSPLVLSRQLARERDFLARLRSYQLPDGERDSLDKIGHSLEPLLRLTQAFCKCQYAVFFASLRKEETVLAPFAQAGISLQRPNEIPSFNWKKAKLPLSNFNLRGWDVAASRAIGLKGIRGSNSELFSDVSCVMPVVLGAHYKGVLALGPSENAVDLPIEGPCLMEIASIIGQHAFLELQAYSVWHDEKRWDSTADLLAHQLRTGLTPITGAIGRAKSTIRSADSASAIDKALEHLTRAERMAILLAESSQKTVDTHVLALEPDDLVIEWFPLSVLVANVAQGFEEDARRKGRTLVVEDSVMALPRAEVDVARLSIALGNVLENAVKYSFPRTSINLRARLDYSDGYDSPNAVIEVDDLGDAIRYDERRRIFEQGRRGIEQVREGNIPGTGLGLWESLSVMVAHGGDLTMTSDPTRIRRRQGTAHHVVFSFTLPINQQ